MSNRLVTANSSNVNQTLRKEKLLICFREIINGNDYLKQRRDISEALRLAVMNSVDGLEVLFHALKERYEPLVAEDKRQILQLSPGPSHKRPNVKGVLPQGGVEHHICESCGNDYPTAKALSGHGPQRCFAKNSQLK